MGEFAQFLAETNTTNIRFTKWSIKPVWSGAKILQVHLKALKDLIELKKSKTWDWDYFINLSESDFPIRLEFF